MEKKKLLLIAVSAGIFMVIVLGASILVFTPRQGFPDGGTATAEAAASVPAAASAAAVPEPVPARPEELPAGDASLPVDPARNNIPRVSIIEPPKGTVPVGTAAIAAPPVAAPIAAAENVSAKPVRSPAAVPVQPAKKAAPAAAPKKAEAKAVPAFWVQTGSYAAKSGADKARENLSSRGLTPIVTNSLVQGKTWYRVRIGPYPSQSEADYWLTLVKAIQGFENSQVWKSNS
jgi:DedD protein